jgi:DNA-binding LacI/PurR family transcriptional regulator
VRERVLSAAAELGYRPNRVARSLRTQKSFEVAVIMPSIDELHVAKLAGFEEILREAGFSVSVLMNLHQRTNTDSAAFAELLSRRPAAAALIDTRRSDLTPLAVELTKAGVPCVSIGHSSDEMDGVGIDRQQGVFEAVKYLADQGHTKIFYLASGDPASSGNSTRLDGYRRAIAELGRDELLIATSGDDHFDQGRAAAHQLVDTDSLPDAVQAFSDVLALGFLAGLHDRGKSCPADLAQVGFDDRASAALSSPPLTTVAQPNWEVGREAAKVLLSKIRGESAPAAGHSRLLPTVLVRRETA